ncbi:hypothetical protein LOK74_04780 [Brevibacillus humidisoli]|nr:hypothetical protein [Brevibacillus humidisoli]UFJ41823.1 hypothetical protein LOK74_04780 [Brevibacillus humidisoli]
MSKQKPREEMIYTVEQAPPAGSVDKNKAHAGEPDEQYPIPAARPVPWRE